MTIRAKNRALVAAIIISVAAVAATLLPTLATSGGEQVREIRIVARDMSFYLEGQTDPNPTLTLRAGERVRIVVRNEDPGMRHDFVITAWSVSTRMLDDRGQEDALTITAPSERGVQTYTCTPHPQMMSGTVRVE